jgi:hypothetical protein
MEAVSGLLMGVGALVWIVAGIGFFSWLLTTFGVGLAGLGVVLCGMVLGGDFPLR